MNKNDKFFTIHHKETNSNFNSNRFGLQIHENNQASLYIDGFNVGALSNAAIKTLVKLLQGDGEENTANKFNELHFIG